MNHLFVYVCTESAYPVAQHDRAYQLRMHNSASLQGLLSLLHQRLSRLQKESAVTHTHLGSFSDAIVSLEEGAEEEVEEEEEEEDSLHDDSDVENLILDEEDDDITDDEEGNFELTELRVPVV